MGKPGLRESSHASDTESRDGPRPQAAFLRVRNWELFQHYRDRNPPWIRLYNSYLDDYHFAKLPDTAKAHFFLICLLASRNGDPHDARVPNDPKWIAHRINATEPVDLVRLIDAGVLEPCDAPRDTGRDGQQTQEQDASAALAECLPRAEQRQSRAETEEKDTEVVEVFNLCRELHACRRKRTSSRRGPPLQLIKKRRSMIRARLREGFSVEDLKDCAQGFYADGWKDRDQYLDPVYAFRNDETVRKYIERHRNALQDAGPQYERGGLA